MNLFNNLIDITIMFKVTKTPSLEYHKQIPTYILLICILHDRTAPPSIFFKHWRFFTNTILVRTLISYQKLKIAKRKIVRTVFTVFTLHFRPQQRIIVHTKLTRPPFSMSARNRFQMFSANYFLQLSELRTNPGMSRNPTATPSLYANICSVFAEP